MAPPAFSKPLDTARLFAFGALGLLLAGGVLAATRSGATLEVYSGGRYVSVDSGPLLVFTALAFAVCGAIYYAFPRITERKVNERLGRVHFGLSLAGVLLGLGYFQGIGRTAGGAGQRWVAWLLVAGACLFLIGQAVFVANLVWSSVRKRGSVTSAVPPGL